jgi:hypothetical protein
VPMWKDRLPKDAVATALVVEVISGVSQGVDCLAASGARHMAQIVTSTTSSDIAGGIGSECLCKVST